MKKLSKYLYACLPLLMVIGIFFLIPNILAVIPILFPRNLIHRILGPAATLSEAEYLNLISVIMYICALIPVACWYYFGI